MKIIPALIEARKKGLKFYMGDTPCKNGNVALRSTKRNRCQCEECVTQETERLKKSYESRKAEIRVRNAQHYLENKAYYTNYQKKYREVHKETLANNTKRHYESNKDTIAKRALEFKKNNPDEMRRRRKVQYEKYKTETAEYVLRRRINKQQRVPSWFSEFDKLVCLHAAELVETRKKITGFGWDIDHMLPLRARAVSGLHCAINLQVIPTKLNRSKGNRMKYTEPLEWLAAI